MPNVELERLATELELRRVRLLQACDGDRAQLAGVLALLELGRSLDMGLR